MQQTSYYPFGMIQHQQNFGGLHIKPNKLLYNSKELHDDELAGSRLDWYDYGARFYDPQLGRWHVVDPLADAMPSWSPYSAFFGNPIRYTDPTGMAPEDNVGDNDDWVEDADGNIKWDENATSQATTKEGEKYLGKNVLVGTHNRDANLNEPINTAKFDLYLESNKEGPSATIMGNTVPADVSKFGTLAEGLYPARSQGRASYLAKGKEDLAFIINEGKSVPTAPGSPKSTMTEIFFHSGNYARASLTTGSGVSISQGCQTTISGPGSRALHNAFMKVGGTDFKGAYYLRGPVLQVPKE